MFKKFFILFIFLLFTFFLFADEKQDEGLKLLLSKFKKNNDEFSYNDETINKLQKLVEKNDLENFFIELMNLTKSKGEKEEDIQKAYLDLIYLLAINKKYNESIFFIDEVKSIFKNIPDDFEEWISFIEIYAKANQKTKQYKILEAIEQFTDKYKDSIWYEAILLIKISEYKKIGYLTGIEKTSYELYEINKEAVLNNQELYNNTKKHLEKTGNYNKLVNLVKYYIKKFSNKKDLENEYYFLAQYYDSIDNKNLAKKYYQIIAENKDSVFAADAIYWLANYYLTKDKRKAKSYFSDLMKYEAYKELAEKKLNEISR
ncbi:MAG TPA: hypothetical protein PLD27_01170 [bacterium]|nr:hypothetical protein [bacterium]HOL46793.1 hypothetical protein [bacterium]HPQ17748.1 hypothetical protein [bacterium]